MRTEILYTTAINERGDLVHVNKAEGDRTYYCPTCKGEFILKKSGNTGKGSKRPHFAHKNVTQNCTAEGVLHYSFKKQLTDLLNSQISEKNELLINWNCVTCSEKNEANLLAKVTSVREEYNLKECQPDIALLDTDDNVIAVIEIVVTHSPESKVVEFYRDNNIILLQINLSSEDDLNNIEKFISAPGLVDYCLSHKCPSFGRYSIVRTVFSYLDKCNRCYSSIERYAIEVNSAFGIWQTFDFTDNEINFVKSKRKNIKVVTNPSTNEKRPASICINCKRIKSRYGRRRRL